MSQITKGLIGVEDLNVGVGTFQRQSSTGALITLTKISPNAIGLGFPINGTAVPTGAVNGVNKVFFLPTSPGALVMVFRNGLLQNPGAGNDYTLSGTSITFAVAPLTGDTVLAIY